MLPGVCVRERERREREREREREKRERGLERRFDEKMRHLM